uniref:Chloride channel protein n=1 Tax=Parascaris univalens TaxID=6257 RepID=A0A915A4U3_PARUN
MYLMSKVERADDDLLNFALTYIVWMVYTMVVMLTSVIFVHYVGPQAIGSGIPEMKTILRGVQLKECLSFRTLLAKMVGLALAIGSGFPIGKEGPFVHVGSIVANLISRFVRNFKSAYANESRSCEMLAAGCAAGVACTFSAPIGGVLFSIEVTAVYFAVRDYWRGFFAAACGSAIFSLLRLYTHSSEVTVVAFYQTTFKSRAFYPEELFIFALMGLFCGITGAIFIWIHRQMVLFLRRNSFMKIIFQRNWIVYPIVICAFYATLTHPIGFGRYITGEVVFSRTLKDFFMNCTWSADPSRFEACSGSVAVRWSADESIFAELTVFVIGFYFLSIVASTLPV